MNHLSTYICLLTTLLSILSNALLVGMAILIFDVSGWLYLALLPLALGTFFLSLLLGHFLGEPLRELHRKIIANMQGSQSIDFIAEGKLYEADVLNRDIVDLCKRNLVQQKNLEQRECRQANFIGDVAHELRTPLTAIRGNAELLLDSDMPQELHDRFCHTIMDESDRLSRLSNELLSLQHIETDTVPMSMSRLNLKTVATEVLDLMAGEAGQDGIELSISGECPDILGNADRLKEVITNIVENALRFTPEGGSIKLECTGLREQAVLVIADTGPGFGDIDPSLLFQRFYRADSSRTRTTGGTGLGLSIAQSIIEAHDGSITAFNGAQGGAVFAISLPALPPKL